MSDPNAHSVIGSFFRIATWASLGMAVLSGDRRWIVASGAFGTLWWLTDVLVARVFAPLGGFLANLLHGNVNLPPGAARLTVDDTVRLLESHIEGNAARHVQIQAALRLADLYRVVYRDDVRAAAVLAVVRNRFPDSAELKPVPDVRPG